MEHKEDNFEDLTLNSPNLAQELTKCYKLIIETNSDEIALKTLLILAKFSNALQLSWFSVDLLKVMNRLLVTGLESQLDVRPVLQLFKRHSCLSRANPEVVGNLDKHFGKIDDTELKNDLIKIMLGYCAMEYGFNLQYLQILFRFLESGIVLDSEMSKALKMYFEKVANPVPMIALSKRVLSNKIELGNDFLSLTRLYYGITDQNYSVFVQEFQNENKGIIAFVRNIFNSPFVDTFEAPRFLRDLNDACNVKHPVDNTYLLAQLGVIRYLQDQIEKGDNYIYRDAIYSMETEFVLKLLKHPACNYTPFLLGEVMAMGNPDFEGIELKTILLACSKTLTTSSEYMKPIPLVEQVLREGTTSPEGLAELTNYVDGIYFSSLGRISKAMERAILYQLKKGDYTTILTVFKTFAEFCDPMSNLCSPAFVDWRQKDTSNSGLSAGWKYLRSILFCILVCADGFTAFLNQFYISNTIISHEKDIKVLKETTLTIFKILDSLSFITARYGLGGLPMFETQSVLIGNALQKFEKFNVAPVILSSWRYNSNMETNTYLQDSSNYFVMIQCRSIIHSLPNDFTESTILNIAQKYLFLRVIKNSDIPTEKLLYDCRTLAHILYSKIFEQSTIHQTLVQNLYKDYATGLLQVTIFDDFELSREAFKNIINGLCDFSPSKDAVLLQNRLHKSIDSSLPTSSTKEVDLIASKPVISDEMIFEWKNTAANCAWECILLLIDHIKKPVLENASIPSPFKDSKGLSVGHARNSLLLILFDQINAINEEKLPELLEIIGKLMVEGYTDDSKVNPGFGIVTNMSTSSLWKALFDAVSDDSKVDYSRRYDCVQWYLDLHAKCSTLKPKISKAKPSEPMQRAKL